jgi:hypothetical protein
MKTKVKILVFGSVMIGTLFTNCYHPSDKLEKLSQGISDSTNKLNDDENKFVKEWGKFKTKSEDQLTTNENYIISYRGMEKEDENFRKKYEDRINELAEKNFHLKNKINNYDTTLEARENWKKFKREFKQDLEELSLDLKDLTNNNTKED